MPFQQTIQSSRMHYLLKKSSRHFISVSKTAIFIFIIQMRFFTSLDDTVSTRVNVSEFRKHDCVCACSCIHIKNDLEPPDAPSHCSLTLRPLHRPLSTRSVMDTRAGTTECERVTAGTRCLSPCVCFRRVTGVHGKVHSCWKAAFIGKGLRLN